MLCVCVFGATVLVNNAEYTRTLAHTLVALRVTLIYGFFARFKNTTKD